MEFFEGEFREAVWPVLMFSQVFGVMPVNGMESPSISKLQFKWNTKLTLYSLFVAGILSGYGLLLFWKTFTAQAGFYAIGLSMKKLILFKLQISFFK